VWWSSEAADTATQRPGSAGRTVHFDPAGRVARRGRRVAVVGVSAGRGRVIRSALDAALL
jgi:hypothetical protein